MLMIDYFRCDVCGESYTGKFLFTKEGKVHCVDCKSPEKVGGLTWEIIQQESEVDEDLLLKTVEGMLFEDIERIYRTETEMGYNYIEMFIAEDGGIDAKKLYFQNNPIDLAIEGQKIAYSALRYLEGSKQEYNELARELVSRYKELRERKLTKEEVDKLWGLYFSEQVMMLLGEDGVWQ